MAVPPEVVNLMRARLLSSVIHRYRRCSLFAQFEIPAHNIFVSVSHCLCYRTKTSDPDDNEMERDADKETEHDLSYLLTSTSI